MSERSICLRNTTEETVVYKLMAGEVSCDTEYNPWYLWPQSEINLRVMEKDFIVLVAPVKTSSLLKEQSLDHLWDRIQGKSTIIEVYIRNGTDKQGSTGEITTIPKSQSGKRWLRRKNSLRNLFMKRS